MVRHVYSHFFHFINTNFFRSFLKKRIYTCIIGTLVEILINRKPVNRDFICNIIFITEILKKETYIFLFLERNYITYNE